VSRNNVEDKKEVTSRWRIGRDEEAEGKKKIKRKWKVMVKVKGKVTP
jgi:hypothetical protein